LKSSIKIEVGEIIKRKLVKREMDNPINTSNNIEVEEVDIQITDPLVLEKLTPFAVIAHFCIKFKS
jgi:hypothetical protein